MEIYHGVMGAKDALNEGRMVNLFLLQVTWSYAILNM